jgi:hypothetical protein
MFSLEGLRAALVNCAGQVVSVPLSLPPTIVVARVALSDGPPEQHCDSYIAAVVTRHHIISVRPAVTVVFGMRGVPWDRVVGWCPHLSLTHSRLKETEFGQGFGELPGEVRVGGADEGTVMKA